MQKIAPLITLLVIMVASADESSKTKPSKLEDIFINAQTSLQSISGKNNFTKYIKNINFECLKEELNLPKNGEKLMTQHEGHIVILSAYLKCFKEDELEFFNFIANELGLDKNGDLVDCARFKLRKIDPKSKLVDNFDIQSFNASYTELCETLTSDKGFDHTVAKLEQELGPLDKFTCGAINKLDVVKFIVNIHVVPFEIREEVRISMTKEIIETFKIKIISTADCIIASV